MQKRLDQSENYTNNEALNVRNKFFKYSFININRSEFDCWNKNID